MTKEELYSWCESAERVLGISGLITIMDEFFKDKLIIQRGENRHPYADVLHEWVEGVEMEKKNDGQWSLHDMIGWWHDYAEYRIKPKDPIYEWQWYYIKHDGTVRIEEKFMTEEECSLPWIKFEETKRLRKQ